MNKYLSDKIRVISLILMIMVVFLHSYNLSVNFSDEKISFNNYYNVFIQNFFGKGVTYIAVPMFFLISGYLFFLNFDGSIREIIKKYKKRSKSLLFPYLLWSFWGLFFYYILQQLPLSKNFFTHKLIVDYSTSELLEVIFLNPIPYQLWFLRDLMVLVLISPLIYWVIKYFRIYPIILLGLIWFELLNVSFTFILTISIFFFCLGAYLSIHKNNILLKKRSQKIYWLVTLLWLLSVLLNTILLHSSFDDLFLLSLVEKTSVVLGIIAVWSMYDYLLRNKTKPRKAVYNLSLFSFFIFVSHEPFLTIVKKGLFFILTTSERMSIVIYFLAPILTILICILLAKIIKRLSPKFYGVITGSR